MNVSRFDMLDALDRELARRERLYDRAWSVKRAALIDRDLEVMRAVRALVAELAQDRETAVKAPQPPDIADKLGDA